MAYRPKRANHEEATMTLTFVYWFLMLLWLLFGGFWIYRGEGWPWGPRGNWLLLFLLFLILGLKNFGSPIKGF